MLRLCDNSSLTPYIIEAFQHQALGVITRAGDVKHLAQPINQLIGAQHAPPAEDWMIAQPDE